MTECLSHQWIKVHEQSLIGDTFPIGWECIKCHKYVPIQDMSPNMGGKVLNKHKLIGAHGNSISSKSGRSSKQQIYDADTGELTYIN